MTLPLTEVEEVKNLTASDDNDIDEILIEQYLLKYRLFSRNARVYYAAADILDMLGSNYNFDSMKLDNQSYTANSYGKKSSYYRVLASTYDAFII